MFLRRSAPHLAANLFLAVAGCASGGSVVVIDEAPDDRQTVASASDSEQTTPPMGDPNTVELAGRCTQENRFGRFTLDVNYEADRSAFTGSVSNGIIPVNIREDKTPEADAGGACVLLKSNIPSCDPPCTEADTTCDWDGQCIAFPRNQQLGSVRVTGVAEPFTLTTSDDLNFQYLHFQDVAHPLAEPGELVRLETTGSEFGSDFSLHGVGGVPLDLSSGTDWILARDQPLEITWDDPSNAGVALRTEIEVSINIDQHGITPVEIECTFDDAGSATVPASVVTALIDFGVTGFPNGSIRRRTADSATVEAGCAELEVVQEIRPNVSVSGFQPCYSDAECGGVLECNEFPPGTGLCQAPCASDDDCPGSSCGMSAPNNGFCIL